MAGHSHWAGIKHKKALVDNKRGKLWSKLSKAIIVAAKSGGGDPDTNIRLRTAIADAKAVSMPKDNIERALKKGSGELDGGNLEEIIYEGYGPAGVAVMCDIMTDNRNRTAPEVRKLFEVNGGKLGETNCVAWMFERKGLIVILADKVEEESLMEVAMEAGAADIKREGNSFEVTCEVEAFADVTARIGRCRNRDRSEANHANSQQYRRSRRRGRPQGAEVDGIARRPRRPYKTSRQTSTSPTKRWRNWRRRDWSVLRIAH